MGGSIRDTAKKILDDNVPKTGDITSNGATSAAFTRMTGLTHQQLVLDWDAYQTNLTSCNAFTGWFSQQIGCDKYLGFFEMEAELTKMGREIAWVDASSGARPKCGDIFRAKSYHVGVSYDCTAQWETCEGGQGGPSQRFDIIRRKSRDYIQGNVRGWIDIELFMAAQKQLAMVPERLTGWWKIEDSANVEYWWFGTQVQNKSAYFKKIQRIRNMPTNLAQGPGLSAENGQFVLDGGGALTVSWKGKPIGEKFRQVLGGGGDVGGMKGDRKGAPLKATKMEMAGS